MIRKPRSSAPRERRSTPHEVVIPTREAILAMLESVAAPCAFKVLAKRLGMHGDVMLDAMSRRVNAMVRDGQLIETRDGRLGLAREMEMSPGRVIGHPDGYAFVRPDNGNEDIFLAPREAKRVLHGDKVLVRLGGFDDRGRPFGNVVEILSRANQSVVGRFFVKGDIRTVSPDNRHLNQEILIPAGREAGAKHGQIVVANIDQQPDHRQPPVGHVFEVLGDHMAPGMEIDIAIRSYQLPTVWPEGMAQELKSVPKNVAPQDCAGREDLRHLPFVTIDGADARDFDDAICCRQTRSGYQLWVAIADVAHYVREDTVLDAAARERGTSVYFPAQVIPMLPEALSNGICSLNPAVDRLALVCELRYDHAGQRSRMRFYNAVICSRARLIYEEVTPWLTQENQDWPKDSIESYVAVAHALYTQLRAQREARGALDIEGSEPKFVFDANRKIERIESRQRTVAHRLIEEFMIEANVAAAEYLTRHQQPVLYRVHARPDSDRIDTLRQFLGGLGLTLGGGEEPDAKALAQVLNAAHARPDRHLIETVLLRSLKLAVYSPDNVGHFGLALQHYAHFTSPIRRYPDLLVHRALKAQIAKTKLTLDDLAALGEHCSMTERRADEATREAVAWLKCEYMLDKVGETLPGIISGVTAFGLFVQLTDTFVEGLVHVSTMPDDYYHFDAIGHRLVGRRTQREYRLGQKMLVRVARVNLDERQIDFMPADNISPSPRQRQNRKP